ncbi:hypothetical protein CMALT394_170158 [Carnobacterium maltaromaticum]|nr:hypothetical protein CMALT394_170158 [Carnobacterium maltaromaticum]
MPIHINIGIVGFNKTKIDTVSQVSHIVLCNKTHRNRFTLLI